MAGLKDISSIWKNIKEIDLKPIRDSATHPVRIVLVGDEGVGRHTLAEQMRTDPARPGVHSQSTLSLIAVEAAAEAPTAHLFIILVDATRKDFSKEQLVVKKWSEAGRNMLVFVNKIDLLEQGLLGDPQFGWQAARVLYGSVNDIAYLQREFIPTVLELLPQQHIALGRQFPLFRLQVARQLINDTCFSNAAYSFSTGLAEIVPVLDLPLNVTDMIVLTKSQAFLAYKLGLLLGFSTNWQDYVTEFGGVIGGGFLWRQIARQLIGLIPAWGILPKVAISYSGTYVVGNAVLGWYLTGRNLSPRQMRALSVQAFSKGKDYARMLAGKLARQGRRKKGKLPAPAKVPELQQGEIAARLSMEPTTIVVSSAGSELEPIKTEEKLDVKSITSDKAVDVQSRKLPPSKRRAFALRKAKRAPEPTITRTCEQCGKPSSIDARFCQYCGFHFDE